MAEKYLLRDNSASILHRFLGPKMYGADIDQLVTDIDTEFESESLIMQEHVYTKDSNDPLTCALIEYKHGNIKKIEATAAFRGTRRLANDAKKPFFVAVYYGLDADHPVPMVLVVPCNQLALNFTKTPCWCSVFDYSKFMHDIRNMPFKVNAPLNTPSNPTEARVLNALTGKSGNLCIRDLSTKTHIYKAPDVSEVWFKQ